MRIAEIVNGIPTMITNEEASLAERIASSGKVRKDDLNERDIVVIDRLVAKNVVLRQRTNEGIFYVRNLVNENEFES